ncbi:MAG: hypothetical protein AAF975_03165, partial [Spirochaetota bacterium]
QKIMTQLKNVFSRALFPALPVQERLEPLLRRLFPEMQSFGLYHDFSRLQPATSFSLAELLRFGHSGELSLWRALSADKGPRLPCALIVPAMSGLPLPYLVLRFDSAPLPPSDIGSPLQYKALALALGQTESLLQSDSQVSRAYEQLEPLRANIGGSLWRQDGIYLYWQGGESYGRLWQDAFSQGFLLPPNPWAPLILPPVLASSPKPGPERFLRVLQNFL